MLGTELIKQFLLGTKHLSYTVDFFRYCCKSEEGVAQNEAH